jgi:hypothetical protein
MRISIMPVLKSSVFFSRHVTIANNGLGCRCAHPPNGLELKEKDGHDFEVTEML